MPQQIDLPPPTNSKDDKVTPAHFSPIRGETGELWVLDEWGLLVRKADAATPRSHPTAEASTTEKGSEDTQKAGKKDITVVLGSAQDLKKEEAEKADEEESDDEFKDAISTPVVAETPAEQIPKTPTPQSSPVPEAKADSPKATEVVATPPDEGSKDTPKLEEKPAEAEAQSKSKSPKLEEQGERDTKKDVPVPDSSNHTRNTSTGAGLGISEWSHQSMAPQEVKPAEPEEDEWQTMPAYAPYDIYDDDNRLIAREELTSEDGADVYAGLGGAGKGYTRVMLDEDAQSATSLDDNTQYLFKDVNGTGAGEMEDEEQRDAVSQMQATKDLLTETQRIAYVGMTRLILSTMVSDAEAMIVSKGSKKELQVAAEAMKMWSQKMMVRLYAHMDITSAEQIMIEQLAEHGVLAKDFAPNLMQNARVKNPMAEESSSRKDSLSLHKDSMSSSRTSISKSSDLAEEDSAPPPPPYEEHEGDDLPEVQTPSQLPTTKNIDIDLRWTVLCDLFLTLIADSVYDARSRVLLEKVGSDLSVDWLEICRFEKRVTDALEMQQAAEKENWNEDEHKESRRKQALKKRYMMMGLATVGGTLVIGLSAGLLAPLIGAGLAAGFTTIGVAGTGGFLAGAGGAAIITSAAATSGGIIAIRAADRRTGAVKTFEYRPLHNNKRVNLIITVSGWMTGKVDDVRLPYSTVDPIMGDIYSILWEPEMLQSMGDTINILATEVGLLLNKLPSTILMIIRH